MRSIYSKRPRSSVRCQQYGCYTANGSCQSCSIHRHVVAANIRHETKFCETYMFTLNLYIGFLNYCAAANYEVWIIDRKMHNRYLRRFYGEFPFGCKFTTCLYANQLYNWTPHLIRRTCTALSLSCEYVSYLILCLWKYNVSSTMG